MRTRDTAHRLPPKDTLKPYEGADVRQIMENVRLKERGKLLRQEEMPGEDVNKAVRRYEIVKKFFYRLRDEYGINVPDIDVFVGPHEVGYSETVNNIFLIVDEIEGKNLEEIESLPLESLDEADIFFTALIQQIIDGIKTGGEAWTDLKNDQYVYGHKKDEVGNKFYLVDVDDTIGQISRLSKEQLEDTASLLEIDLIDIEKKFLPNIVKMVKAREKLKEFKKLIEES